MTEERIAELEKMGFKRWTNGNMDRLYINTAQLGIVCEYYKTGNIRAAEFNGDEISNTRARAMKNAKTYIDVKTGKLYSDHDLLAEAAQELIDQAEAEIKAEEEAEAKKETETSEEEYSAEEIAQTIVSNGETELALTFMGLESREELYKKVGVNTDEEAIAEFIRRDNGGFRTIAFPLYMII